AVFGDYIDVYDIQRAVEDGNTVRIYYEGRLAKLELEEAEKPKIDPEFEEVTEGEEQTTKEKLKGKWARLEAMVGTEKRVGLVAHDLVEHFERRLEAMDGKAMLVCMSRRICVELYSAIARVNRVFKDKPGGLVVDYLGLAAELRKALAAYTESGGKGAPTLDQNEAAAVMLEKYEVCCGMFHGFDYQGLLTDSPAAKMSG